MPTHIAILLVSFVVILAGSEMFTNGVEWAGHHLSLSEAAALIRARGVSPQELTEDYYAHGYLGNMYLSLGDLDRAELEYSRAYTLFPSDEARAQLAVVRKRRAAQSASTRNSASATRAA